MKLFQIEEPDGSPSDPDAPGAAIGIDVSNAQAEVAIAVGGNAVALADREGFELSLPVPGDADGDWQTPLLGAQLRAERALARPVTHAVIAVRDSGLGACAAQAAEAAGITVLRVVTASDLPANEPPACGAAILAEELAPRPDMPRLGSH